MRVRRRALKEREIVTMRGHRATSIERTLADVSGRLSLTEAVVESTPRCACTAPI